MWTRESIEAEKPNNRPFVRCRVMPWSFDYGRMISSLAYAGRIIVDGNNPWVEVMRAGKPLAFRFSWEGVLEALNNPKADPLVLPEPE